MKTRGFETHRSGITDVAIVRIENLQQKKDLVILFTFGLDCISIWNMRNGKMLNSLDVSSFRGRSICGTAVHFYHCECDMIVFAFATHNEPSVHSFDYKKNIIGPPAHEMKTFDVASNYCKGHQQAISSMTFSHDGSLVATSSWDSTCMVWKVSPANSTETVRLTLLIVLPIHEDGSSCLAFTMDNQNLVTCGECIVKVWDVSNLSENYEVGVTNDGKGISLDIQLQEWEQAIPYSFSIEKSINLFAFDESMPTLVANHDWLHFCEHDAVLTLLAPAQSRDEWNEMIDVKQCLEQIIEEIDPNDDEFEKILRDREKHKSQDTKSENNAAIEISDNNNDAQALTTEESARLKTQFRSMKDFDFEKLFTPALSFSDGNNTSISAKSVTRVQSRPDANDRLLRTFSKRTTEGVFSSHSSTITSCAVAQELDLVVTVALDKSIRYWSLEQGVVLETIFDAHDAPITCCALTSPTTCDLNVYEMLLASGGSDNLVKVWRRNEPKRAECVFSLSGHNDTIRSVAFDPSGVFLVSSSEDTTAIVWRVRPSSPDQPELPVVISVDRFSISISWTEPLANGAKILHYIVRTKQVSSFSSDNRDIVVIADKEVPAKYLSKTVDKLQPGVKYTLQVAAVNQIGTSEFSIATEPIETLAFIPSRIERPVHHDKREATRITLSWTPPCPNGAPILSYTIQCRPEKSAFVPLREITISVDDLEVSYEPAHAGVKRSTIASKTINTGPAPNEKRSKGQQTDSTGITKTTKQTRSASTISKKASVSKSTPTSISPSIPTLSYTVDELWAGEVYQFVVAASNRCGLGEFSRVSDYVKMDCTAPDQPEKPVIAGVDKRQIDVQWEKPRCNGSEVLQYTLWWSQEVEEFPFTSEQSTVLLTRSIAMTKYTVLGLEPGRPVKVWISASNLVDNKLLTSPESPPSDSVATLCDVPNTPAAPELLEPSAHTLMLAWTPPKRNGLPIDGYNVALYSEDTQFGVRVRKLYREISLRPHDLHQLSANSPTVTFVLHHLRGSTFYSAAVSAFNSLGTSGVSDACVPVQTSAPTVPDAILAAPTISVVTPTSAIVTWKLPAHDGGSPLRGFHVEYSVRSNRNEAKMERGGDITVSHGLELNAMFLKPHRLYRFRVCPENRVGYATPSVWSDEFATPSLVEFTVTRYFACRPPEEHNAARYIQGRYRAWKKAVADNARFTAALVEVLRHWHL
ncbi:hypothetical protein L915_07944 [Phytophthora nicotianae]|uniref:Fibronectin type-III domain-containing protein n=1 Tax=Phytophthora nicotianae TaxID=4792 RepID=W2GXE6_PHYNI|nr:hypothetical protein L915_07944 [Phytophthora nicotianae]